MTDTRSLPPKPPRHGAGVGADDCPPPETLAAYLDGGLDEAMREQVEDHISRCEDCYFVVRETGIMSGSDEAMRSAASGRFGRPRQYLLPLAAMLVVGLGATAVWREMGEGSRSAGVAGLVREVGPRRFFEARLSGGFRFGPLLGAKRGAPSASDRWGVMAEAAKLKAEVDKTPSAQDRQALAAAHLFVGETGEAVRILEGLAKDEPRNAFLLNDLAAAYLTRFERDGRADDPANALESASIAFDLDPKLCEALFNKALALELLHLREQATEAWEAYVAKFPADEWLPAVREHLEQQSTSESNEDSGAELEGIRRRVEEDLLAQWAASAESADGTSARHALSEASRLAKDYRARTADTLLADETALLSADAPAKGLVAGHRAYARALTSTRKDAWAAAAPEFTKAQLLLRAAKSPFSRWATVQEALCAYYLGQHDESLRLISQVLKEAPEAHRALRARALWIGGLVQYARGRPYEGLLAHRDSVALFDRLGERQHAALVSSLLGNDLAAMGRGTEAWTHWLIALRAGRHSLKPKYAYLLYAGIARASQRSAPRVASCLTRQMVARIMSVARFEDGDVVASALIDRARVAEPGSQNEVLVDLAEAERLIAVGSPEMRAPLQADIDFVRGHALASQDPEKAIAALSSALEFFQTVDERFDRTALLTQRAQLSERLGRTSAALDDAEDGLAQLRSVAVRLPTGSSRLKLAAQTDRLATQMVSTLVRNGHPERALLALEEIRALVHGRVAQGNVAAFHSLDLVSSRLPPRVLVVEFVVLDRDLAVWAIARDLRRFRLDSRAAAAIQQEAPAIRSEVRGGIAHRTHSAAVYQRMFGWLGSTVERYEHIIVVPDAYLYSLPFAALIGAGAAVHNRQAVSVAPSLFHVLRRPAGTRRQSPTRFVGILGETKGIGVLGLSPIGGAQREIDAVGALYSEGRTIRSLNTPDEWRSLQTADVVHFAGHALKNEGQPELESLVLRGRDGPRLLFAQEVESARLTSGTAVVLAACRTGVDMGVAMMLAPGLVQAFLDAGASSVIASLWDVDDHVSELLMPMLHRALASGALPEEALRTALEGVPPSVRAAASGVVVYVADRADTSGDGKHGLERRDE